MFCSFLNENLTEIRDNNILTYQNIVCSYHLRYHNFIERFVVSEILFTIYILHHQEKQYIFGNVVLNHCLLKSPKPNLTFIHVSAAEFYGCYQV
jgi:hypothetical protein